jgi:hypothetical protein
MIAPHTFELSLDLDSDGGTFYKWLEKAKDKTTYDDEKDRDYEFVRKGMTVWFPHKNGARFKKRIKLIINPSRILGKDDVVDLWKPKKDNILEILDKVDSLIEEYFNSAFRLNNFNLSRIDFTSNIHFDNPEKVAAYIKILYNIRKVKGFSPKYGKADSWYDEEHGFDLKGNSKDVEFTAYDKAAAIKKRIDENGWEWEYKKKELKAKLEMAKGFLRLEVKLTSKKAIREYTKAAITAEQIYDLCKNSQKIFGSIFLQVVPYGDFYKKDKAVSIVQESITDKRMKKKMLTLLELIPKKKSLHLAIKELNDRKIEQIMKAFTAINLSPVTISKRQDAKHLKNLWTLAFTT